jgi:hypothetical protein
LTLFLAELSSRPFFLSEHILFACIGSAELFTMAQERRSAVDFRLKGMSPYV